MSELLVTTCLAVSVLLGAYIAEKRPLFPLRIRPPSGHAEKDEETLREQARKELGIDSIRQHNVCFIGNSGTGKSSFINALTKAKPGDHNYAEVGEVETTSRVERYELPPHAVLWDVPGVGTYKHPADSYVTRNKLYAFDIIIICTVDRFTSHELHVAADLKKWNIPIIFVRAMTDVALTSKLRRMAQVKMSADSGKAMRELRAETEKELRPLLTKSGCGSSQIFYASSWVLNALQDPRNTARPMSKLGTQKRELKRMRNLEMDEQNLVDYIVKNGVSTRIVVNEEIER
ncbi:hypothetical protein SeLEV6574_g03593 [Synchytrium endobioticum]|uniref:IRG-type G domain-containing protein n=1 Tax=Synchytrium endobioticum TaxID=286115 RepID=A0A507D3I6_9FUNG|nr:hypothetical protein SeLEV6574_g03593 [Synchytrium endobioticum]